MAYIFFAIYFYYLAWLAVRLSGCAAVVGSCGALEFEHFQQRLRQIISLGHDGWIPILAAFALFLASLSYLVMMRKAPGGAGQAVPA